MASDLISPKMPAPTAPESNLPAPQRAAPAPKAPSKSNFADELERGTSDAKSDVQRDLRDASASDDSASKDLRPLKKAALKAKDAVDNNPALAFLTGHLERLQPAQIPELVTTNEFLTDAMSEADLSAFMNKAAPLAQLIGDLGLPASLVQDAKAAGLDPNQMITPNELLKALGIDAQRVFAELKVLKDTANASGFAPYLKRAKAASKSSAATEAPGAPAPQQQQPNDDHDKTANQLAAAAAVGASLAAVPSKPSVPAQPAVPSVKAPSVTAPSPLSIGAKPSLAAANMSLAGPSDLAALLADAKLDAGVLPNEALAQLSVDADHPADLSAALAEAEPSRLADAASEAPKAPALHRATHDAFAWMGERMQASDVSTVSFAPEKLGDAAPADDLLQAMRLQGAGAAKQSFVPQPTLSAITAENRLAQLAMPKVEVQSDVSASRDELLKEVTSGDAPVLAYEQMFDRDQMSALTSKLIPKRETGVPLAELAMARTVPVEDLHFGSFKGGGQGFMSSGDETPRDELSAAKAESVGDAGSRFSEALTPPAPHAGSLHGLTPAVHAPKADAASGMTPEQRVHLMQQVLDRATVMMKDGHSSVRLDFGTPELGKLELAMKMSDDNKLEMRIMTGSDRAREIMASELNHLRNALAVQNIHLGNVEVGVGGRDPSAFAGFAGQQQHQQQQNHQEQAQRFFQGEGLRGPLRPLARAVDAIRPGRLAPLAGPAAIEPGRIEIRV